MISLATKIAFFYIIFMADLQRIIFLNQTELLSKIQDTDSGVTGNKNGSLE